MSERTGLPLIDLSSLSVASLRSQTIDNIKNACKEIGFFQIINHGISERVAKEAIDTAMEFFELCDDEENASLTSEDIYKPVRYGSITQKVKVREEEEVCIQRGFLKHYSHPLSNWIHLWPSNPPNYREKMGKYAEAVQQLVTQLIKVVLESLGLNPTYLHQQIQEGTQVMAVNFYPPPPPGSKPPEPAGFGWTAHSDHGLLTVLLQSCQGLRLKDQNDRWVRVPYTEGTLLVLLGDQMEVLSNGEYKSVIHQAITMNDDSNEDDKKRISIATIYSFALEEKIRPAPMLVNEKECPRCYEESSFRGFLDFISSNNGEKRGIRFIDTLKKKKNPMKEEA